MPVTDPMIYAMSDLHLQAPVEPFLFTKAKEAIFAQVAEEVLASGSTLLLAGDVFDLTGMTLPSGLKEFYAAIGIPGEPPEDVAVTEQIAALARAFPDMFAMLSGLAKRGRLRFIPGNHDCAIASKDGRLALAKALGIQVGQLRIAAEFRDGETLFGCHGNEFDAANMTGTTCKNPGSAITSALYHAIIPALDHWGLPEIGNGVPAVRPEEKIVPGLQVYLDEKRLHTLLVAFVELLRVNGYFASRFHDMEMWIATHVASGFITPAQVESRLHDDVQLSETTRHAAEKMLAAGPDAPKLVVMGHTHVFDGTSDYVNLGTWIDHVGGLTREELATPDRSLPVLKIDDARHVGSVHDCQAWAGRVSECKMMWTWGS
jgi:UDP-2,3-diacylglucosamine pyrophosphatase LpxH